jgi:hypothetical protein
MINENITDFTYFEFPFFFFFTFSSQLLLSKLLLFFALIFIIYCFSSLALMYLSLFFLLSLSFHLRSISICTAPFIAEQQGNPLLPFLLLLPSLSLTRVCLYSALKAPIGVSC